MAKRKREVSIETLWRKNRDVLKAAGYTRKMFYVTMDSIKKSNKVRNPGAWKIFKHKREFTDRLTVGAENLIASIKQQDDYKEFRKEVIGWKNKIDYEQFTYKDDAYRYVNAKGDVYQIVLVKGSYGSQYWSWRKVN